MTDPFALFDTWFAEAQASEPNDPNAMALATADAAGRPSSRMVLLKGHGPDGFVFYTNRGSRKAGDLAANAAAALLFHWKSLRRQVRVEGRVEWATDAESDAYFASRGRDSQLGAWASDQSRPLDARETFEASVRGNEGAVRGRRRAAPALLGRLSHPPRPHRVLAGPRRIGYTSGASSPAPTAAGTKGLLYP